MKNPVLLIICVFLSVNFAFSQRKSITNASLEKYRQERLKNESDYRANYKKLGLPSPEELAKREVEEQKQLDEYTANTKIQRQQISANFQVRANIIRTEIAATDAELNYLRSLISRLPNRQNYVSLAYPIFNYVQPDYGNGISIYGAKSSYRKINTVRTTPNVQIYQNYSDGNYANVNIGIGYKNWHGNINLNYGSPYYYGGYAFPYRVESQNYERQELVSRLRLLEQQRAGLFARWNLLDEEARRFDVRID